MDENQVLELVEFYEDMIEKQDEIIVRQSRFIKSLATELSHLRRAPRPRSPRPHAPDSTP